MAYANSWHCQWDARARRLRVKLNMSLTDVEVISKTSYRVANGLWSSYCRRTNIKIDISHVLLRQFIVALSIRYSLITKEVVYFGNTCLWWRLHAGRVHTKQNYSTLLNYICTIKSHDTFRTCYDFTSELVTTNLLQEHVSFLHIYPFYLGCLPWDSSSR